MCVYSGIKFQVSSIILTTFRQVRGNFNLLPTAKRTPKKPSQVKVNFGK